MTTQMINQTSEIQNCLLVNKGFILLDALFKENGWYNIKNEINHIAYTRFAYETEYFEIKIDQTKIHVSIPVKNTTYQYKTSFDGYFQASEYIEQRFKDFIV